MKNTIKLYDKHGKEERSMFKKVYGFLFLVLLIPCLFIVNVKPVDALNYRNYYDVEMTHDEYETLINLGFTEDEIYYMTEDVFLRNKDADATLLTRSVKYYKTVYKKL